MEIIIVITIISLLLLSFVKQEKDHVNVGAQFGSISEHVSIVNKGFSLNGSGRVITRQLSHTHLLVVAESGAGKSSCIVTPSLFCLTRGNSSMAVLDIGGDQYRLTAPYMKKKGINVYCLDFSEHSDGFNIFSLIKNVDDIEKAAHTIVQNSGLGESNDKYWSIAAEGMLSVFMRYTFFYASEKAKHMANVALLCEVFSSEPKKIDVLFIKTDEKLLRSYKTLVAMPERQLQSVISTTLAALKIFKSPTVARCTSLNTIPFDRFRSERSIFYLAIPLNQVNFLAPISALIFEFFFQEILSRPPAKNDADIYLILDELVSFRIQNLSTLFSQCRRFRCGCIAIVQHPKMLNLKYSPAEVSAIEHNCHIKAYLGSQAPDTAQQLQEILGKEIITDENGRERKQYLMDVAQIRMNKEALILIGGEQPLREPLHPYYKHWSFNSKTKLSPLPRNQKIPLDEPFLTAIQ